VQGGVQCFEAPVTGFEMQIDGALLVVAEADGDQSDQQLLAIIPAAQLASPGTIDVSVNTPAPGGGTSAHLQIGITTATGPQIMSASPSTIPAGSPDTQVVLTGVGFDPTGRVFVDPASDFAVPSQVALHTVYTSPTSVTVYLKQCMLRRQLTFTLTYALHAADAGTAPDGGASATVAVVVGPPNTGTCVAVDGGCGPAKYICENNKCCGPMGANALSGPQGCCSGLSMLNNCQDTCTATGAMPPNGLWFNCCGGSTPNAASACP